MLQANLREEITSALQDPYHQTFGGLPISEDPLRWMLDDLILRYQEILLDAEVSACIQKRSYGLVAKEWQVDAASDRDIDQKAARFIRWMLDKKLLFDSICLDFLDAIVLGYKVGEILWDQGTWEDEETKTKHKVVFARDVRVRDSKNFTFHLSDNPKGKASLWGYELRFLTSKYPLYGEALPDKKFIIHSVGSKTSNPLGLGLGSKLYWPHQFKKQATISALTFGDRFAQPTVIGKYQPEQSSRKLEEFVRRITEGTSATLPEGMEVTLLEASRSSSQNFYDWLLNWCETQIKKVILSEMFTGAPQGLSGQPAANDEKVRDELIKSDADLLHAAINDSLIKWAVEFSFAGAVPPTVWRVFEKTEDLNARANRDQTLNGLGFQLTFEKFQEVYGEGYQDAREEEKSLDDEIGQIMGGPVADEAVGEGDEAEAIAPTDAPADEQPTEGDTVEIPDFSAHEIVNLSDPLIKDPLEGLVSRTAQTIRKQSNDWLSDVRGLMSAIAQSDEDDPAKFSAFKEGLLELQQQARVEDMAQAIAQSSLIAEMGGRFEVMLEVEEDDD